MSARAKLAMGLWMLLAVVIFNVRFDWQVRMAGHAFVRSQIVRHEQGQPTLSINEAFRPRVRGAAADGARWSLIVAALGAVMTLAAAKWSRSNA